MDPNDDLTPSSNGHGHEPEPESDSESHEEIAQTIEEFKDDRPSFRPTDLDDEAYTAALIEDC